MGLRAVADDASLLDGPERCELLADDRPDPPVLGDLDGLAPGAGCDRDHPLALERTLVGERVEILLVAAHGELVELGLLDLPLGGDTLGGREHRLSGHGIAAEVVEHPVLGVGRRAGRAGARIDEVRAVARTVGRDDEARAPAVRRCPVDARDRGRARLSEHRAARVTEPEPGRERRRAVERLLLRDGDSQHDLGHRPLDAGACERVARDLEREVEARDVGRRPLPAHERARPRRAHRNPHVFESHLASPIADCVSGIIDSSFDCRLVFCHMTILAPARRCGS